MTGVRLTPALTAHWDEVFSHELTYITPTFRPLAELVPGIQPRVRQDVVTVTHPFWSGAVVHAPGTGSQKFTWVLGQWNVPDVTPAAAGQGSWYSLAWIGIDGISDVTQIGTVQSASADASGNLTKNCYAIYEWWPQGWQIIGNFPVSFGDTMLGLIKSLHAPHRVDVYFCGPPGLAAKLRATCHRLGMTFREERF